MAKRKGNSQKHRDQWMRDKDLRSVVLFITVALFVLCLLLLYILAKVDQEGYGLLLYPFAYVFHLYPQATPGEKLGVLSLPVGGIIGWFLNRFFSKKH